MFKSSFNRPNLYYEVRPKTANVDKDIIKFIKNNPEKTPYSMEIMVEQNPGIIFITSMGEQNKIEERLKADIKSNPSWNSLQAVKNNKIYILPENLFLLNPGLDYPQAIKFMAKTVYPEAF